MWERRLRRFGRTIDGEKQEGLTLSARAGATVVAPLDARVQYSGPFRTYGQMAILDVGGDVLVVVSGWKRSIPRPDSGFWPGNRSAAWLTESRPLLNFIWR